MFYTTVSLMLIEHCFSYITWRCKSIFTYGCYFINVYIVNFFLYTEVLKDGKRICYEWVSPSISRPTYELSSWAARNAPTSTSGVPRRLVTYSCKVLMKCHRIIYRVVWLTYFSCFGKQVLLRFRCPLQVSINWTQHLQCLYNVRSIYPPPLLL